MKRYIKVFLQRILTSRTQSARSNNFVRFIVLPYSRERTKSVELFPRTDNTHKIHYWPIPANEQNEKYRPDIEVSLSFHVETVVWMSRTKEWFRQKPLYQGFEHIWVRNPYSQNMKILLRGNKSIKAVFDSSVIRLDNITPQKVGLDDFSKYFEVVWSC